MNITPTAKIALALAAAGAVLAGCGADVNSGEVTGKHYEEAYTWYTTQCLPSGNNACASTMMVPHFEPEHYVVTLTDCSQDHDAGTACPSEDHNVAPGAYAATELGDQLNLED